MLNNELPTKKYKHMKHFISIIKKTTFIIVLSLVFIIPQTSISQENNYFEISKNLDIFSTLFKELDINYVDEIKPGELTKTSIDAMLKSLDPYTVYIPESKIEDYKFMTTGQYGGIGATINQRKDDIYIFEIYYGSPAYKAGLKAGDKIIKINDKPTKGKTYKDISKILKGQAGTKIKMTIERYGENKPIEKTIVRKKIKIDDVPYFGMLNDSIAYIKLTSFTQNSGKEVKKNLLELKKDNNVKGLVFDIRGNGGGLLNEAVYITNIFVKKGELVVSTKGKLEDKNKSYKTLLQPVDLSMPLVILVDKASASASEILAGAIQDLDRGVILGQRTFGKGLVQNVIPLSYNTILKVTVAKYYIPSGRCIQAVDYSHKDENGYFDKVPDSLKFAFKTKNGRIVYGSGGIKPDIVMKPIKFSNIALSLYSKYLIFDYATKFCKEHHKIASPKNFQITDSIYNDFVNYLKDKNYDYVSNTERLLKEIEKTAVTDNFYKDIKPECQSIENKIKLSKKNDFIKFNGEIKKLLKMEIISRYYYQKGRIESFVSDDKEIKKAITILNDTSMYNSILNGTYKKNIWHN